MSLKDRFDLVILDWGGTVIDFGCEAPVRALIEAFGQFGVRIDAVTARRDMGKAKAEHVRALFEDRDVGAQWQRQTGRAPSEADTEDVIRRLGPLMRAHAATAATLLPGVRSMFDQLHSLGLKIGSSTGYTREMMQPVLERAAAQGYRPDHLVCSGETAQGRPAPLMIYKACAELGVWPLSRVVKVDDAEVGIAEGKAAGAFTVGVASGNTLGLSWQEFQALPAAEACERVTAARATLQKAGADLVLDSVADLVQELDRLPPPRATTR